MTSCPRSRFAASPSSRPSSMSARAERMLSASGRAIVARAAPLPAYLAFEPEPHGQLGGEAQLARRVEADLLQALDDAPVLLVEVLVLLHEALDESAEDAAREVAVALRQQRLQPELFGAELALRDAQQHRERGGAQVRPEACGRPFVVLRRPAGSERAVVVELAEVHRGERELVPPPR